MPIRLSVRGTFSRFALLINSIFSRARASRRIDSTSLSTVGLVAVLVLVPSFAFWGALTNYEVGAEAKRASIASDAYERARYSVAEEESLERKYRLEPSPEIRAKHVAAAGSLIAWLQNARTLEGDTATAFVDGLIFQHTQYLFAIGRLFAAVDEKDTARADAIDRAEVDPAFDNIEQKIFTAADARRVASLHALDRLAHVQRKIFLASPVVLGGGLVLVIFFVNVLRRSMKQTAGATAVANRRSERRFHSLVRNSSDLIVICDAASTITYQAPTTLTSWGFAANELCGDTIADLVHPKDQPALREIWQQILKEPGRARKVELRARSTNRGWRYGEFTLTNLLTDSDVEGVIATALDITERKRFEMQLVEQAFYDSLTALPNRALLSDRIDQALARALRRHSAVGLIYVDLDNFKRVNDSLGHQWGDALLIAAGKRLRSFVRPSDTIARLGGDEFVILLDPLASDATDEAILVAQRILTEFKLPFLVNEKEYVVSASLGIALTVPGDRESTSEFLLRDADVALSRAKTDGRGGYVVFDAGMQTDMHARLEMETDLRQAMVRNELRVLFQPIVQLQSQGFHEVEALVRWEHPTRGLVMPADFVPIAEETGLIIPIGQWVLEQSCHQVALWQAQFHLSPPLQVSVNLSPRQFEDPDLLTNVKRALASSRIASGSVKLEVTEGVIMRNTEASILTLQKLKDQGIRIAIDDFGTGYSSLSYLKRLPLDVLKIDRSFIEGIGQNTEDNAIVRAILSLAHSLNLTVTAEGVETEEQAALLREWSCEQAQGYLFARPLDTSLLADLLQTPEAMVAEGITRRVMRNGHIRWEHDAQASRPDATLEH